MTTKDLKKIMARVPPELWDLAPSYAEHVKKDLKDAADLMARGGYDLIANMAHRIKGSAGTYGMGLLSREAQTLMDAARSRKDDQMLRTLEIMREYLERVVFELSDED